MRSAPGTQRWAQLFLKLTATATTLPRRRPLVEACRRSQGRQTSLFGQQERYVFGPSNDAANFPSPALIQVMALKTCLDGSYTCIELTEAFGEWFVRVVQDGQNFVLSFDLESFAVAYAEGERLRLGLAKFDRV
jgi:hypothetical protein